MKLSYRGVPYDRNISPELTVAGDVMGRYRGAAWRESKLAAPAPAQLDAVLCYRGVTYRTQAGLEADLETVAKNVVAPVRMSKAALASAAASAHKRSILASLEHRLASARNRGDERLVHILEDEMRQFA